MPSKIAALDLWDTTVYLESLCWLQQCCSKFTLQVLSPRMLYWGSAARSLLENHGLVCSGIPERALSQSVVVWCKVNTESSSFPPVSLRWVIERNHGYEWNFTQPHIQNASVELRKHMDFTTFLSSSPAPSVFQTEGWKNRKILFTVRELKEIENTDASLGCKVMESFPEKPPTLLRDIYLQIGPWDLALDQTS